MKPLESLEIIALENRLDSLISEWNSSESYKSLGLKTVIDNLSARYKELTGRDYALSMQDFVNMGRGK